MRSIIRLSIALCFLVTAQAAAAQEYDPITGAFGWTLGEPLTPEATALLGEPLSVNDGMEVYLRVTPPEPVRFFDVYKLHTAPNKGAPAAILGFKKYDPELANLARNEYQELVTILEAKYGPSTQPLPQEWKENGYKERWGTSRDGREVNALLREFNDGGWQVYIEYYDWDLYNQLKEEASSKEADAL